MRIFFIISFLFSTFGQAVRADSLVVWPNIKLPKDSVQSMLLISNLNDFLKAAQKPNEENIFVFSPEKIETYILLDEIRGIGKNESLKNDSFFKPYLTNVIPLLDEESYLIQISYLGVNGDVPILNISFELIAHKVDNNFLFSSPLRRNTKDWNETIVGNYVFHCQGSINEDKAKEYEKIASGFDQKLGINKTTEIYCSENVVDLLQLLGVQYKLDYNGFSHSSLSSVYEDKVLIVTGNDNAHFDDFDPHDLFHEKASVAISDGRNHYMVCGCAYVYGGSWGISWEEIQDVFKKRMPYDKNTDWLKLYYDRYNFGESKETHLLITQFINALIIQKTEKEKGFSAVRELLTSGNMVQERENFFKILYRVTGIDEKNFNNEVYKLVDNAVGDK